MSILIVGGVNFPEPSSYVPSLEELSKAERNARGRMIKEVIAYKYKLEISWKYLTSEQMTTLINAKMKNYSKVEFIDLTGNKRTAEFYPGTPSASAMEYKNGRVDHWLDIKMNFIEM
ncbi:hypothetical protein [Tissierella sp.]|uniref:hypothetical protein n=1 Tax=Tissierella sp. TaxID=41274 RepID=UPI00302F168F